MAKPTPEILGCGIDQALCNRHGNEWAILSSFWGVAADWQLVPGTLVLAAGRYRVTVASALPKEFFRFRHP